MLLSMINADWRVSRVVLGDSPYQVKLDMAKRLVPLTFKSERAKADFLRLVPALEKAGRERNAIVHASWTSDNPDEATFIVHQTTWNRGKGEVDPVVRMKPRSPVDLDALADEIADVHERLMGIYGISGLPKSSTVLPDGADLPTQFQGAHGDDRGS